MISCFLKNNFMFKYHVYAMWPVWVQNCCMLTGLSCCGTTILKCQRSCNKQQKSNTKSWCKYKMAVTARRAAHIENNNWACGIHKWNIVNPFSKTFIVQWAVNKNAPKINTNTRTRQTDAQTFANMPIHTQTHTIWQRGKLICFNGLGLSGLWMAAFTMLSFSSACELPLCVVSVCASPFGANKSVG